MDVNSVWASLASMVQDVYRTMMDNSITVWAVIIGVLVMLWLDLPGKVRRRIPAPTTTCSSSPIPFHSLHANYWIRTDVLLSFVFE